MQFSRKMWLLIILKVTKSQGFTFSLKNHFWKNHRGEGVKLPPTPILFTVNPYLSDPGGIYLLKVKNRNTRKRCGICSNLTIKTPTNWMARGNLSRILTLYTFVPKHLFFRAFYFTFTDAPSIKSLSFLNMSQGREIPQRLINKCSHLFIYT